MNQQLVCNYEEGCIEADIGKNMIKWFIYSDHIKKSDHHLFTIKLNALLKEYGCSMELKNGEFIVRKYRNNN